MRVLALTAAFALAACPSSSSGKKDTTPTSKPAGETPIQPATAPSPDGGLAPQDVEPVVPPEMGGPSSQPSSGPALNPNATQPMGAVQVRPDIKPPGQDLPIDKRDALVADHLARGDQALAGRDADTAIREARAALDLDESCIPAMVVLAHGYFLKEYDDKAEAVLNEAKGRPGGKDNAKLWMLLGLIYDRAPGGRENEALAAYEAAAQLKPDYLGAQTNRGAIYLKRKRYADAVAVYETVTRLDDRSAHAWTALGSAYRGLSADPGQARDDLLARAENAFRQAMARDPNYKLSYFNMGLLYLDADPFPGLDTKMRLENAVRFLKEYKRLIGPAPDETVDKTVETAEKALKKENDRLERKRKKDEEAAKKAAEQPAQPAPGGGS